jgi:hypothetical protein
MTTEEALMNLLGDRRSGDERTDLIEAAREAMRRREQNSADGGAVIAALVKDHGVSYRELERQTGIPVGTAHRWAAPPKRAEPE